MLSAVTASGLAVGADWAVVPREPLFCEECNASVRHERSGGSAAFHHCMPVVECPLFQPATERSPEGLPVAPAHAVDVFGDAARTVAAAVLERLALGVLAASSWAWQDVGPLPARNLLASLRRASLFHELTGLLNLVLDLNPARADLVEEPPRLAFAIRELVEALPWKAIHAGQRAVGGGSSRAAARALAWRPMPLRSPHFLVVDESLHTRNRGALVETLEHAEGGELRVWTPDRGLDAEVVSSIPSEPTPFRLGKIEVQVPVERGEARALRLRGSERVLALVLPVQTEPVAVDRPVAPELPKLFELKSSGKLLGVYDERRAFEWLCAHDSRRLVARPVGSTAWLDARSCFPAHFAFD